MNLTYLEDFIHQSISWGVDAGKGVIVALIIFFVGKMLISLINTLLAKMLERRNIDPTIQSFLKSFVNVLLIILLLITTVSALGVNTTSFAALLASAGVAVGMALSGNLQNLAGGILILLFRPYRVGDYINAQGFEGKVKEIQIFHTILLTYDNREVFIPNGAMSSGNITNLSTTSERRYDLVISVEYGEDIEKVRRVLLDIVSNDSRILQTPEPVIILDQLAASSVDVRCRIWVNTADYWSVANELTEKVYNEFNRQHINFPFPQIVLHNAQNN